MTESSHKTLVSKDRIEYKFYIHNDIVTLNKYQIDEIENFIVSNESVIIESGNGIRLQRISDEQSIEVITQIEEILSEADSVKDIVDSELIDYTQHALERINDKNICIDRDWNYEQIHYEIAECLKRAFRVDEIRINFDSETKMNCNTFTCRVRGLKNKPKNDEALLVIYFDIDPVENDRTIKVVTILTPNNIKKNNN